MVKIIHKYLIRSALMLILAVFFSLLSSGCGRDADRLDERDRQHPMMRRALAIKDAGDVDGALELFERVIEERPGLVRAHLEAAMLYDTHKNDYIRAIYHYQRYLEKRPETDRSDLIEGLILSAELSFAASLDDSPQGALEAINMLRRENAILRDKLATATGDGQLTGSTPATPAPPAPEPAEGVVDLYTVEQGDTLTRIAQRTYGDPNKWRLILEANSDVVPRPEDLRVGQRLVIPEQ